jgi:hypothetical protein
VPRGLFEALHVAGAAMSARSVIFVVATVAGLGCSVLNRTGPDDTCASLENGAVNDCKDGILATCVGTRVTYRVCDDSSACEQSWQTPGAYLCSQSDPPFVPTASSPSVSGSGAVGPDATAAVVAPSGGVAATCGTAVLIVNTPDCAQCVEGGCCGIAGRCGGDAQCQACVRQLGSGNPCPSGTDTTYDQLASTCFQSICVSSCSGG